MDFLKSWLRHILMRIHPLWAANKAKDEQTRNAHRFLNGIELSLKRGKNVRGLSNLQVFRKRNVVPLHTERHQNGTARKRSTDRKLPETADREVPQQC